MMNIKTPLTLSVLSLVWSILYVAGKGLMGYIHVQTILTSPAILGLLFLTIPKSHYTLKWSARIRIRAHSTERVNHLKSFFCEKIFLGIGTL